MLEASRSRITIAIEPLAQSFLRESLLLENSDVVYLSVNAEKIPLNNNFAEVIVSGNALDHVENLKKVAKEIARFFRPGGYIQLNVDIHHRRHLLEPRVITENPLDTAFPAFTIIHKRIVDHFPSHARNTVQSARYIYQKRY